MRRAAGSRTFSVLGMYKEKDVKQTRNRHEMEFLARVIDLMRKDRHEHVLEALVRRLVGVETADRSGNWKLCDAFELITEKQSFVPDDALARVLKTVRRIEAIDTAGRSSTNTGGRGERASRYTSETSTRDRRPTSSAPSTSEHRVRSSSRGPSSQSTSSAPRSGKDAGRSSGPRSGK